MIINSFDKYKTFLFLINKILKIKKNMSRFSAKTTHLNQVNFKYKLY